MTTIEESKTMETCAYKNKIAELREENRVLRNQVYELLKKNLPVESDVNKKPKEECKTDPPKCRYCGQMHDGDYYQPWEYCPCTFCGKKYSECLDSCVRHDMAKKTRT